MEERMQAQRTYEFLYMLSGKLSRDEAEAFRTSMQEAITGAGGTLIETGAGKVRRTPPALSPAGESHAPAGAEAESGRPAGEGAPAEDENIHALRLYQLSYPIRHQAVAYNGRMVFAGTPDVLTALREYVRHDARLIRSMLTKKEPQKARPERASLLKTTRAPETPAVQPYAADTNTATAAGPTPTAPPPETPIAVEDLDKKLEEIVG